MIYLDNAATTCPYDEVIEIISRMNKECYANPSSMHSAGYGAEKELAHAKEIIMNTIGAKSGNFIFTSGGTESNNQIFLGILKNAIKRKPHIITTAIEHPSVLEVVKFLESLGCEVSYVLPDASGVVSAESVEKEIRDNTKIVSVMAVNNETGAINPIAEIGKRVKSKNPEIIVHSDCVQALGNIKISVDKWGIDAISLSAHKICGPKGVGGLYVRDKVRILPIILGGHQQKDLRSGTENVPNIVGFAKACEIMNETFTQKAAKLYVLKETAIKILAEHEGFEINNEGTQYSTHIVSIRVKNVRAEVMLHALESYGICVSAGSACSTNKPAPSHVLLSQGYSRKHIEETIRVSFGAHTDIEEVMAFCDVLIKEAKELSRFTRA